MSRNNETYQKLGLVQIVDTLDTVPCQQTGAPPPPPPTTTTTDQPVFSSATTIINYDNFRLAGNIMLGLPIRTVALYILLSPPSQVSGSNTTTNNTAASSSMSTSPSPSDSTTTLSLSSPWVQPLEFFSYISGSTVRHRTRLIYGTFGIARDVGDERDVVVGSIFLPNVLAD